MIRVLPIILFSLSLLGELHAQVLVGPYGPPAGDVSSTAIHKDSAVFRGWASSCTLDRGPQNIANTSLGLTTVGSNTSATDKSGINGVVSLGDGGSATLTFDGKVSNGAGADFAVFENSFSNDFLELAFVEVSSDGLNFFRFDAVSLTDTDAQTGGFGSTDATNLYNLAGKYRAQYGTPFDLDELSGTIGLDVDAISHIRIVDVIGNISNPSYTSYDSQNNAINDPWPTAFASGGFDLDAIGVIHYAPTAVKEEDKTIQLSLYPNPASNIVYFNFEYQKQYKYRLTNINGSEIEYGALNNSLDISHLNTGIYFIHISAGDGIVVKKIIKQ